MVRFCDDIDILKHEPVLYGNLHFRHQVLAEGSAAINGGKLIDALADFTGRGIASGGVVHVTLGDASERLYEIVEVNVTELTLSVLRESKEDSVIVVPDAAAVTYRVSSFAVQAAEAAFSLTQSLGIQPGNPASDIGLDQVLDIEGLRRVSTLAVICGIYASLAAGSNEDAYWQKSLHYRKLFDEARQRCRVCIDKNADGISDLTMLDRSPRLVRD